MSEPWQERMKEEGQFHLKSPLLWRELSVNYTIEELVVAIRTEYELRLYDILGEQLRVGEPERLMKLIKDY